jgi:hypothetical protein
MVKGQKRKAQSADLSRFRLRHKKTDLLVKFTSPKKSQYLLFMPREGEGEVLREDSGPMWTRRKLSLSYASKKFMDVSISSAVSLTLEPLGGNTDKYFPCKEVNT